MLSDGEDLLSVEGNYSSQLEGKGHRKRMCAVIFNSSRHTIGGANMPRCDSVDDAHIERFLMSVGGEDVTNLSPETMEITCLSLHCVTILSVDAPIQLDVVSNITADQVHINVCFITSSISL